MSPFVTVTIASQCPHTSKVTLFVVFCDLGLLRWVLDLEPDGGRPLFPTMQPSTKLMATPISPTDRDRRAAGGLRENRCSRLGNRPQKRYSQPRLNHRTG